MRGALFLKKITMSNVKHRIFVGHTEPENNTIPPEDGAFTFDSTVITFDSMMRTFDETP